MLYGLFFYLKTNYGDYMIAEPIDCNEEQKRISGADYELCTALLTMLLREDHFSNGSFDQRFADGQVLPVIKFLKEKKIADSYQYYEACSAKV